MPASFVQEHPKLGSFSPDELFKRASTITTELIKLRKLARDREPRWQELMNELQSLIPNGVYEHYKSTPQDKKLYSVAGVSQCTEDPWNFVVTYGAQYEPFVGVMAHRPLFGDGKDVDGFLDPVERGATPLHRFRLVRACAVEILAGRIQAPNFGGAS